MPFRFPYYTKPKQTLAPAPLNLEDLPDEKVRMPMWMYLPPYGVVRLMRNGEVFNANEMRLLGSSTSVWQCKKIINDAVVSAHWDILPVNPDSPNEDKVREVKQFLSKSARDGVPTTDTFNSVIYAMTGDILDLDAGVIVKVFGKNNKNRLVKLHARDGSTIFKETDIYGNLIHYWQYDYRGIGDPIKLEPREIAYVMMNPKSDSAYGESPLESIRLIVRGLVKGMQTHELIYRKGGIPSGILATTGMTVDEHEAFKKWWEEKQANKVYQRAMLNIQAQGSVNWIPLITNFRDLQFLESQHWFTELVYRTYKVPIKGIGTTQQSRTGETTEESRRDFMKGTVIPILTTIEQTINQQIIPHFYEVGETPDVEFHYSITDLLEEKEKLEVWGKKWEVGAATVNEFRREEGKPNLKWGDYNPMALKQLLSIAQSWWYGAMDNKGFSKVTGIETPNPAEILARPQTAASKPPMGQEEEPQEKEEEVETT